MNNDQRKKRRVQFAEAEDDASKRSKATTNDTRLHSGKYTLESDEEDDDEQSNGKKLDEGDFVEMGRENATIDFDDEVKITPFNVDEELEDGNYDETGCFQWKKKDVRQFKSNRNLKTKMFFHRCFRKKKFAMLGSMKSIGPMLKTTN